MVNVVITAPRGHMDSLIVKAAYEREDIRITGGVGPVGREYIGCLLYTSAVQRAVLAAECIVEKGIDKAMNEYNIRQKAAEKREDE